MVRRQVSLALSKATASELLASGGIRNEWLECGGFDDGCGGPASHRWRRIRRGRSGPAHRAPTVLVYLPILAERVRAIRVKAAGRSNPALATIQTGHLVGLTIAHEVGHVLGLPHAPSGVMRARLEIDDLLSLGAGRLAFTSREGATMRLAALTRARQIVADAR